MPTNPLDRLEELDGQANVIDAFDRNEIDNLAGQAIEEYRIDRESRAEWESTARESMRAMLQEKRDKNYPFPNASNVRVPLLATAALQFAARSYPAIVQSPKMVRSEIIGKDNNQAKQERADRIETHMSYQLMKEIPGWESDTDTLLHQIPAIGCAFRKVYYSLEEKRPESRLIPAMDLVVNQATTSLDTVPRISHRFDLYPHEIQSRIRSGTFTEFDYKSISPESSDEGFRPRNDMTQDRQAAHSFIEQHRYEDLDGDGYAEPWIVTLHEGSERIVRVAPNYDLMRATMNAKNEFVFIPRYNYFVKYGFVPDPAGGFYDVGFGLLLRTLSDAVDTSLNQMLDAGHLQTAGGGFIGSGLNLKKSELRFSPGVYHVVNAPGGVIKDAVVPMQHQGASETLLNLLTLLIDFAKQVTAVQDILTGETQRAQPATTTLAQIEQGLMVFSAIYKRIFRALGQEYKLLYELNYRYPSQEKYLEVLDWQPPEMPPEVMQMAMQTGQQPPMPRPPLMVEDYSYADCDIVPKADAQMVTDMQQLARAQVLLELAGHPVLGPTMNAQEIAKRVLAASKVENLAEIIPPKQGPTPQEQLALAGMQAEVEDKQASAVLKQAQAMKAQAEAGVAGQGEGDNGAVAAKAATDAQKLELEAIEKERRFALDVHKAEREGIDSDRNFALEQVKLQLEQERAEREFQANQEMQAMEFEASRADAERDFVAGREDAAAKVALEGQKAGQAAFESDRQAMREDERNKRADLEADRSREDERERADKDGKLKLKIEQLKAKNKPSPKK